LLSQKEKEFFSFEKKPLTEKPHGKRKKKSQTPATYMQFQDSKKKSGKKQTLSPTIRLPKECKETGNRVVTEEQQKELRLNSNLAQIRNCKS
jgi:hypothetical protein